jgi:hypothetical protein
VTAVATPAQVPARFAIRIGRRSRLLLFVLFGVRERNSYVEVTDADLDAHFGLYRITARLENISEWRIEGPWLWITAIGLRRGIRNGDFTFGGNHNGGVVVDFREPVAWHFFHVPRLYVTVGDLEGLGAALAAAGIPGRDARRSRS